MGSTSIQRSFFWICPSTVTRDLLFQRCLLMSADMDRVPKMSGTNLGGPYNKNDNILGYIGIGVYIGVPLFRETTICGLPRVSSSKNL